jgi:hypothetical protein
MRGCLVATVFVMLGSMVPSQASAQRSAAKVTGRVVDQSEAPFPSTLNTRDFRVTLQPTFKYFDIEFWRLFVGSSRLSAIEEV